MPMQLTAELAFAAAALVVIAAAVLLWRRRSNRSGAGRAPPFRGPATMQFTCAGCAGQFPHTKRTVAAWEKGSRRVFCDACHKQWRNARPPEVRSSPGDGNAALRPARGAFASARPADMATRPSGAGRRGCLGVALLLVLVPVVLVALVTHA
jgi:hypothetical protein